MVSNDELRPQGDLLRATIRKFRIVQTERTRHVEPVANCDRFNLKPQIATPKARLGGV